MDRKASAVWNGSLKEGKGTISAPSGAFTNVPYSFATRFETSPGTNPEELIAAAHSACFSMALSGNLGKVGITPTKIATTATVTLERNEAGPSVTKSHLVTKVSAPGLTDAQLQTIATETSTTCPISRLLNTTIIVDAILEG